MRPVEEKIFHEEDEVNLKENFPKWGKLTKAKIDADHRGHVARNGIYHQLVEQQITYSFGSDHLPVYPFPRPFSTLIDPVLLIALTKAYIARKRDGKDDQLEEGMNYDRISADEGVRVLYLGRPDCFADIPASPEECKQKYSSDGYVDESFVFIFFILHSEYLF